MKTNERQMKLISCLLVVALVTFMAGAFYLQSLLNERNAEIVRLTADGINYELQLSFSDIEIESLEGRLNTSREERDQCRDALDAATLDAVLWRVRCLDSMEVCLP